MKEWCRAHLYVALSVGAVLFFVLTTALWWVFGSRNLASSLTMSMVWTLGYFLIAVLQVRRSRKSKASLEEQGQFLAYVRYPDCRPGSLSSIWNQGIATPGTGFLLFQPALYDSLEPLGQATTITIQSLLPARRKVDGKDRKYISAHGLEVMALMTAAGRVEMAAHPESLDRLGDFLTQS